MCGNGSKRGRGGKLVEHYVPSEHELGPQSAFTPVCPVRDVPYKGEVYIYPVNLSRVSVSRDCFLLHTK